MLRELRLKETLLDPPGVPARLNNGRNVCFMVRGIERPENYGRGVMLVFSKGLMTESGKYTGIDWHTFF